MNPSSPQRPSRILLVILSLSAGGAERVISEMANWWAARSREVAILTLWGKEHDHYELDPRVQRLALDFWKHSRTPWQFIAYRAGLLPALRQTVKRYSPDAVISFIDLINITMATALAGTRVPLIISERIDPRHHAISPLRSLARRATYPLASSLVVQTASVARWAQAIMKPAKIEVIPNFVRMLPGSCPAEGQAGSGQPIMLAVGRLDRQKGHDLLLQAFAATDAARSGWRLVILGEGPERPNLERLASELGIQDAVSMPGVVREPAEWLYEAQLFVLPSRYEGFPNALLEAMACGCAVIAADCPSGPAEIVRDGENGLLIPVEDVHALGTAMLRLMGDEGLRRRLGTQALQVRASFSQDSVMALWDSLIENVSGKRR
jgi:GalNAc-alpha-(1->4)-GalNAc-alpha-(1->3)-diNAcBac-PP-undecaprenol alpha-1,4-N-acetyl-D-galactosaminyltransferase